jgi:hypothetical protein
MTLQQHLEKHNAKLLPQFKNRYAVSLGSDELLFIVRNGNIRVKAHNSWKKGSYQLHMNGKNIGTCHVKDLVKTVMENV